MNPFLDLVLRVLEPDFFDPDAGPEPDPELVETSARQDYSAPGRLVTLADALPVG